MENFLSVNDVADPQGLVEQALKVKYNPFAEKDRYQNKSICLIFFNPSLRTRLSTELAAKNLGLYVSILNISKDSWQLEFEDGAIMNMGTAEHIKEAAAVIGSYFDIIGIRTFPGLENRENDYNETVINAFVKYSGKPILNLESATVHPLQSLADLITIKELCAIKKTKVVLTWAPHPRALPQAVPNSFAEWCLKANHDLTIVQPKGFELNPKFTNGAKISHDQQAAFEGADVIYVKNWSSYDNYGQKSENHEDWIVNLKKLKTTNNAILMHCLPVRRNVVIADDALDSSHSVVIQQANNRIYSAQVVLKNLLK